MEILAKQFEIQCTLEELNIIHKALSILTRDVKDNKGYGKDYLKKVIRLMEETGEYW